MQQLFAIIVLIAAAFIGNRSIVRNVPKPDTAPGARAVVERYLEVTLPPPPIDYEIAETLLAPTLRAELDRDISFVPRSYGIQDSPDRTSVTGDHVDGSRATVTVDAYYGSSIGRRWTFILERRDTTWEIIGIQPTTVE